MRQTSPSSLFLLAVTGAFCCTSSRAAPTVGSTQDRPRATVSKIAPGLHALPMAGAARVDRLRLLENGDAPTLLFSMQVSKTPPTGWNPHQMTVSALSVSDVSRISPVASLPRLLPPAPAWDARREEAGETELVFEEAQGALYRLLLRGASGDTSSPNAAHPLQSFHFPRFVRGPAGRSLADVAAVLDKKSLVVFRRPPGSNPPAELPVLASAHEAVVGVGEGGVWAVTKSLLNIPGDFGGFPGRLTFLRLQGLQSPDTTSSTPFAGVIAVDFDAIGIPGDVAVFATGKPAALLLASRPSQPIAVAADDRGWLSALSRPSLSVGGGVLRLAAIAHAGTPDAKILYGELPLASLPRP